MVKQLKLVDLTLNGNLINSGFDVSLTIYDGLFSVDGELEKRSFIKRTRGQLPSNPELSKALEEWRDSYHRLGTLNRGIVVEGVEIGGQFNDCRNAAEQLKSCFFKWLNSLQFKGVETSLRDYCALDDQIQILLEIQNKRDRDQLQHLPWHLWSFVNERKYAEIAFQPDTTQSPAVQVEYQTQDAKVLAIVGYGGGINTNRDLELLTTLESVTVLREPDRSDIDEQLWTQNWDILFFAGHSDSQYETGKLYLNRHGDYLTIEELSSGLEKSIGQGLKLAIFNSCDGLGLAYELERLYFPQIIVMKEPIPDQIAHKFLNYFLKALKNTDSVYIALRVVRRRLRDLEKDFPCASWLPVLFHNPATATFKWPEDRSLADRTNALGVAVEVTVESDRVIQQKLQRFRLRQVLQAVAVSCLVVLCVVGLRSLGILQTLELKSYDQMMRLRPDHLGVDNRVLVITIDQEDIAYQRSQGIESIGSLSDQTLLQILQKVEPYGPSVVASDVIHDFEYSPDLSAYIEKANNFIGICLVKVDDSGLGSIAPPPGLPVEQLGFINFPLDPDAKVRRQFLKMSSDNTCKTEYSLSFAISSYYLKQQNPNLVSDYLDDEHLRFGNVTFQRLSRDAGGYALPQIDAEGFQVLINYRSKPPPTISLREFLLLEDVQLQSIVHGRIILIGVADGKSDEHRTPYNKSSLSSTAGVVVHAQMTSHLVSTVLGDESTIRWWSSQTENLWVFTWGLWGALSTLLLLLRKRSSFFMLQGLIIICTSILLFSLSYFALSSGVWIPLVPVWFSFFLSALSFSIYLQNRT